jgi:uncharacterized membrane protein YcaP (DUF421 family)
VVLIDEGKVVKHALAKELLTRAELMTVLHRQGFASLHDVERCVLEPGGTFFVMGKTPPTAEIHHAEVLKQLGELSAKLDLLAAQRSGE